MDWWWSKGGGDVARLGIVWRVETVGVALQSDSHLGSSSLNEPVSSLFPPFFFPPLRLCLRVCVRARRPKTSSRVEHEINRETVRFGRFVGWG